MNKSEGDSDDVLPASAPWNLTGNGYILVYRFPPAPEEPFAGGLGMVMLVDYETSDVGPYREMLFIPGFFRYRRRRYLTITEIYVSTRTSVVNGRRNWGIPKELASFEVQALGERVERISVQRGDDRFATFTLEHSGWSIPMTTALVPRCLHTLAQPYDGRMYLTAPSGRGRLTLARLRDIQIDEDFFPDVTKGRLLFAFKVTSFELLFPRARVSSTSTQASLKEGL